MSQYSRPIQKPKSKLRELSGLKSSTWPFSSHVDRKDSLMSNTCRRISNCLQECQVWVWPGALLFTMRRTIQISGQTEGNVMGSSYKLWITGTNICPKISSSEFVSL